MRTRMNEEIKKRWIADLRSGKYEQGQGSLEKDGKYCCLGVLCLQAVEAGIAERWVISQLDYDYHPSYYHEDGTIRFGIDYDASDSVAPACVYDWAGLEDGNPSIFYDDDGKLPNSLASNSLAEMNDSGLYDFNQIADVIEREF